VRSVLDVAYVEACLAEKTRLPLAPHFFISPSKNRARDLDQDYDAVLGLPRGKTVDKDDVLKARAARKLAYKEAESVPGREPRFYRDPEEFLLEQDRGYLDDNNEEITRLQDVTDLLLRGDDGRRVPVGLLLAPVTCCIADDALAYLAPRLRVFGATLVDRVSDESCTHVLVKSKDDYQPPTAHVTVVDEAWLAACIDQRAIVDREAS